MTYYMRPHILIMLMCAKQTLHKIINDEYIKQPFMHALICCMNRYNYEHAQS